MTLVTVLSNRSARREERVRRGGKVVFRRGPNRHEAQLLDLSRSGLRLRTTSRLQPDERIWLKLDMLEPLEGQVVWAHGNEVGCRFLAPLHPAVFQVLSRAS